MGLAPVGALSVPCPLCRSRPGRVCVNRRGYFAGPTGHRQRRALWLAEERAEVAEVRREAGSRS